jgi:hypothetical protein
MKVIVRFESLEMTIQTPDMNTRPTISGTLWETMKDTPINAWLDLYRQSRFNRFEEIDFALALMKDPLMEVNFVEPIDGYEAEDGCVV